jgi:hypothetical protein
MPRVKIGPAMRDRKSIDVEVARLRDLDVGALRARWHTTPPSPRPLQFRRALARSVAKAHMMLR